MTQYLPREGFRWLSQDEIERLNIMNVADDNDEGYVLEVDVNYPTALHDLHSDYPLAPQKMKVTNDMLSPYARELKRDLDLKETSVEKLVPNFNDKENYILHYKNLKLPETWYEAV